MLPTKLVDLYDPDAGLSELSLADPHNRLENRASGITAEFHHVRTNIVHDRHLEPLYPQSPYWLMHVGGSTDASNSSSRLSFPMT